MTTKQQLVEALRALCRREGGVDKVADETESSAENLRHILAGVKLPSGAPRGVGPNLQRRLDTRYPGWATLGPADTAASELDRALPVVLDALSRLTEGQWRMVRVRLDEVVGHPEMRDDVKADLLPLLASTAGKRHAAAA